MKQENENNHRQNEPGNFGLPEGYFQKSAQSIVHKIEWQEEHKDFPKLAGLKQACVFEVPENYFFKSERMLESIQYPALNAVPYKNTFTVPGNYFDELGFTLSAGVLSSEEQEEKNFEKLNALGKQHNFNIPQNYFQEQKKKVTQTLGLEPAKIIPLFSRRMAYAAAALLVVVIGAWIYNFYQIPPPDMDCNTIACLDKQDLVKTKDLENFEDEELYDLVDPAALERKLENKVPTGFIENKDSSLNDVSDYEDMEGI